MEVFLKNTCIGLAILTSPIILGISWILLKELVTNAGLFILGLVPIIIIGYIIGYSFGEFIK